LQIGNGNISVVEGDEYDSVFFAKIPKFSFYKPDTAIVTSIEYDHADIYPDLAAINAQFSAMIMAMPAGSSAICCIDGANARQLVDLWRRDAKCSIISYGSYPTADAQIVNIQERPGSQLVSVHLPDSGRETTFELQIPGRHNATNALAVFLALHGRGFEIAAIGQALAKFRGVRRRQDVRFDRNGITVIDDFAHHPTAVSETLAALARRYSGRKLWAVFEPRSNTSRLQVFQSQYVAAFGHSQRVVLSNVQARSVDDQENLLDVTELAQQISDRGTPAIALPGAEAIAKHLLDNVREGDVVVIMSNGSFDGLVERVVKGLGGLISA